MSNSDVAEAFYDHVFNYMPAHLLHISNSSVRLIHREDLAGIFNPEQTTTEEVTAFMCKSPHRSRAQAVRDLVAEKLQFAIFSHRWLAEGEPTFQAVAKQGIVGNTPGLEGETTCQTVTKQGLVGNTLGLWKVIKFCVAAAEVGCKLAWCDTCCIDKTSSAELDECIRSMFKWYRHSAICIIHLARTGRAGAGIKDDPWFRRGWTLQELLAPTRIKFYAADWSPLSDHSNDKDNTVLMDLVSDITGIDHDNLRYFSPGLLNVREKMVWASLRKTTRSEDIAYSLLGIFNISIPIAYGEGKRAFRRLMEAVAGECREWQIFAWAGPHAPCAASFPKSPAGYLALTDKTASLLEVPRLEHRPRDLGYPFYTMTKKGLELGVLMAEMMLHIHRNPIEGTTFEHLTFSPSLGNKRYFEDVQATCDARFLHFSQWAVGIINYHTDGTDERGGKAELEPGKEYVCFLFGTGIYSPHGKWEKVETKEVLTIRTREVVRRDMTIVWL